MIVEMCCESALDSTSEFYFKTSMQSEAPLQMSSWVPRLSELSPLMLEHLYTAPLRNS
jgi:hypothetical protein